MTALSSYFETLTMLAPQHEVEMNVDRMAVFETLAGLAPQDEVEMNVDRMAVFETLTMLAPQHEDEAGTLILRRPEGSSRRMKRLKR